MHCDFAPMEGVTGYVYRNLHRAVFGGAARYYLPFVSVGQSRAFSRREWQDLCPEHNTAGDLVPQLLGKDAEGFIWAARALRERGYKEINLNLGCPSGTVTAKGKGAGFLAHPEELERFLDTVFSALEGPISIKTRLGFADPAEFEALAALYGRYPLSELIIHPRVRRDFYKAPVRMEAFAAALPGIRCPVCYNGDLLSREDCAALLARFPQVERVMIGRGLIADPALLAAEKRSRETLRMFHEALYEEYCAMFGNERNAVMRMKEVWFYHIHLFEDGEKLAKRIRRAASGAEYRSAAAMVYDTLPLREKPQPGWV